jgi:hypothetical protein
VQIPVPGAAGHRGKISAAADDLPFALREAPLRPLRAVAAPRADEPGLERRRRREVIAQLQQLALAEERTAGITAVLDDGLIAGRARRDVALILLKEGSVVAVGAEPDHVLQLVERTGRQQVTELGRVVVDADRQFAGRRCREGGRQDIRGAADGEVGEGRRVAGAGLRFDSTDQIRGVVLTDPDPILTERERVTVDEHLRLVGLHAADDDRGVLLASHALDRHVRQMLQNVVDLRIAEIRKCLRGEVVG